MVMNEQRPAASLQRFFSAPLAETDPELAAAVSAELVRQQDGIELIASENAVSAAVLEAQGSVLTNKYAEGYPGRTLAESGVSVISGGSMANAAQLVVKAVRH